MREDVGVVNESVVIDPSVVAPCKTPFYTNAKSASHVRVSAIHHGSAKASGLSVASGSPVRRVQNVASAWQYPAPGHLVIYALLVSWPGTYVP